MFPSGIPLLPPGIPLLSPGIPLLPPGCSQISPGGVRHRLLVQRGRPRHIGALGGGAALIEAVLARRGHPLLRARLLLLRYMLLQQRQLLRLWTGLLQLLRHMLLLHLLLHYLLLLHLPYLLLLL